MSNARSNPRQDASTPSDILDLNTDFSYLRDEYPGKVFRVVNDEKGRIQKFIRQGWEPVQTKEDQAVGSFLDARQDSAKPSNNAKGKLSYVHVHVGQINTTSDGRAMLMMIDEDLYQKIQAQRMQRVIQSERALDPKSVQGDGVETYAPNLPTGGTGLNIS